jgi:hypothetical protein
MWLNNFSPSTGISTRWSPRKLILRHKLDYKNHCRALFGSYCETYEDHEIGRNTTRSRGMPAICLGPTGNIQGTYQFFSLATGQIIKRRGFYKLPALQSVIDRVTYFARNNGVSRNLVFTDRHCVPFTWPDNHVSTDLDDAPVAPYPDIPAKMPGVQFIRDDIAGVSSDDPLPDNTNQEPDWTEIAEEARYNADLDASPALLPTPEILDVDANDDNSPLPSSL